nr:DUF2066 domain-containing protein [Oceanococcus sp. HetDA_MAG_MS8]
MRRKLWSCIQALALLLVAWAYGPLAAAEPDSPAELVQVAVADRSREARDAALRAALDQAVVRLAGERGLREFWIAPGAVLTSYQYRRVFDGQTAENLALDVRFDVPALRQALADAGLPVWNQARPDVLLWLHANNDWLDAMAAAERVPEVIEVSQGWGYGLRFPQLDLAERRQVSINDLQAGFQQPWIEANAQYAMPLSLAVALEPASPPAPSASMQPAEGAGPVEAQYTSYWWLLAGDQLLAEFGLAAAPLAQALDQAWSRMNGQILEYQLFLRQSTPTEVWTLRLEGVNQADDYLQALHELRALEAQPEVQAVRPGELVLQIRWQGEIEKLHRLATQWGWEYVPPALAQPLQTQASLQSYGLQAAPSRQQRFRLVSP